MKLEDEIKEVLGDMIRAGEITETGEIIKGKTKEEIAEMIRGMAFEKYEEGEKEAQTKEQSREYEKAGFIWGQTRTELETAARAIEKENYRELIDIEQIKDLTEVCKKEEQENEAWAAIMKLMEIKDTLAILENYTECPITGEDYDRIEETENKIRAYIYELREI